MPQQKQEAPIETDTESNKSKPTTPKGGAKSPKSGKTGFFGYGGTVEPVEIPAASNKPRTPKTGFVGIPDDHEVDNPPLTRSKTSSRSKLMSAPKLPNDSAGKN